jgi:hypothetical protein
VTALQPVDGTESSHHAATLGGDFLIDGKPTGWKLRGMNEANVIRRQEAQKRLREFYGPAYDSLGMGV